MRVFGKLWVLVVLLGMNSVGNSAGKPLPASGITGVYEVTIDTDVSETLISYLTQLSFTQIDKGQLGPDQACSIYGVDSALTS
ncbi:MAG: hypothetical protein CL579_07665 [Alteromonadaceae bacterium]|jgi:hypothetical protein|nr:hypothetical protein [Alteromonadaceae bacterium]